MLIQLGIIRRTVALLAMTACGLLTTAVFVFADEGGIAAESKGSSKTDLTDMSMQDLMEVKVYGASKYEQKVTEAPSSVSIVTAAEIKKYGYRTLADILKSLRSFYITYDRNYSYVGVRGFGRSGDYNTRILLLVDGHRTNDNIYDSSMIGTEFIMDIDLIDRVEVIRGPGSSLYGSNAFFAVVNVITRRGQDLKGAEISGEAGSHDTYKGRLSYGNRFQGGLEAIISGSGFDSKGDDLYYSEFDQRIALSDPRATNNGMTNNADYDRDQKAFTKLSYKDLTLEMAYSSRTKGIPTASFGVDFNDPHNKTIDSQSYLDLKYDVNLGSQSNLTARLFYDWYEYEGEYCYSGITNKDRAYGEWWGGEVKYTTSLFDTHKIILGTEYQDNRRQDQKNFDDSPSAVYLDSQSNSHIEAGYVQDEFTLAHNLIVSAGVRYDYYSTFGGTTNPRLGFIYSPFEKTTFKALYGSAFRAPNNYEMNYQSAIASPPSIANPDLQPEKIKTYELVYEQYIGSQLRGTAVGYYYRINDLISQTLDAMGNQLFQNIDAVEALGLELELEGKSSSGIEGRVSYAFQDADNVLTHEQLSNSPTHVAKINVSAPIMRDTLFAGIEEQFMSRRKTLAGNYASSVFITNITLFSQHLEKNLSISLSVYNLFDEEYGDPASEEHVQDIIDQDGRTFRVKLVYRF